VTDIDRVITRIFPCLLLALGLGSTPEAQERAFLDPLQVLVQPVPVQLVKLPGASEKSTPSPFDVPHLEAPPPVAGQARLLRRWQRTPESEFVWMIQTPLRGAVRATTTLTVVP